MCVPQSAPMLLTRNLLYTGITRARKLLIVLSNKNIIEFMIQNTNIKKRNTGLKYKLQWEIKNEGFYDALRVDEGGAHTTFATNSFLGVCNTPLRIFYRL